VTPAGWEEPVAEAPTQVWETSPQWADPAARPAGGAHRATEEWEDSIDYASYQETAAAPAPPAPAAPQWGVPTAAPRPAPPGSNVPTAAFPAATGTRRPAAAAEPAGRSYDYVDAIRASELVPTRKVPPARGWRKAVYLGSFKTINPGQSPDERRQAELEAKIRSVLRGRYKIGILGKGGVGKTTIAAGVGSVFAEMRPDDRVVAVDADTAFGKLASRIDPTVAGSYWELAADAHLDSFSDIRTRVGSNRVGLFVLGGETATARRRVLEPGIYREAMARLDRFFTVTVVDCGSTMDSPVTQEALADLDALIVVTSPWVDGASAAGQTLEWLGNHGYTGLLHRTVLVINDNDGHADERTKKLLVEQFSSRGQTVIEVPFDTHLRPAGVVDIDHELDRTTRRRFFEIAAALAEHFAATTDGPGARR
jgi:MinD-like ATPase involved in chromosome partitioning or flagellar assembly